MEISTKPRYNLNLVLKETGLKADTIRAWERRYQLPLPARSEGGHRLYSDYDLAVLNWLLDRQAEGMRISQAADYWKEMIGSGEDPLQDQKLSRPVDNQMIIDEDMNTLEQMQQNWINHCLNFDEPYADQILSMAFAQFPLETVLSAVILPSLNQIGQLWYSGEATVQQEHFLTEVARKKIQALITAAPKSVHTQRILIACPPGEYHSFASLILKLLLSQRGWEILYLGANVPIDHLNDLLSDIKIDLAVLTAFRIKTAASLLEITNLLLDNQIPVAYGGWIFTKIPELVETLPGTYLGTDLLDSIQTIENMLINQASSSLNVSYPLQNQDIIDDLNRITPDLNNSILEKTNQGKIEFNSKEILEANHVLIQDISAALLLGDIKYLQFDLSWLSRLFSKRKLKNSQLEYYLESFRAALAELLGPKAELINRQLTLPGIQPLK